MNVIFWEGIYRITHLGPLGRETVKAEFSQTGDIFIEVWYMDEIPDWVRDDLELLYTYNKQINAYKPILPNGRLL